MQMCACMQQLPWNASCDSLYSRIPWSCSTQAVIVCFLPFSVQHSINMLWNTYSCIFTHNYTLCWSDALFLRESSWSVNYKQLHECVCVIALFPWQHYAVISLPTWRLPATFGDSCVDIHRMGKMYACVCVCALVWCCACVSTPVMYIHAPPD